MIDPQRIMGKSLNRRKACVYIFTHEKSIIIDEEAVKAIWKALSLTSNPRVLRIDKRNDKIKVRMKVKNLRKGTWMRIEWMK